MIQSEQKKKRNIQEKIPNIDGTNGAPKKIENLEQPSQKIKLDIEGNSIFPDSIQSGASGNSSKPIKDLDYSSQFKEAKDFFESGYSHHNNSYQHHDDTKLEIRDDCAELNDIQGMNKEVDNLNDRSLVEGIRDIPSHSEWNREGADEKNYSFSASYSIRDFELSDLESNTHSQDCSRPEGKRPDTNGIGGYKPDKEVKLTISEALCHNLPGPKDFVSHTGRSSQIPPEPLKTERIEDESSQNSSKIQYIGSILHVQDQNESVLAQKSSNEDAGCQNKSVISESPDNTNVENMNASEMVDNPRNKDVMFPNQFQMIDARSSLDTQFNCESELSANKTMLCLHEGKTPDKSTDENAEYKIGSPSQGNIVNESHSELDYQFPNIEKERYNQNDITKTFFDGPSQSSKEKSHSAKPESPKDYYLPSNQLVNVSSLEIQDETGDKFSISSKEKKSEEKVHVFFGPLYENILLWLLVGLFIMLCQIFCFQNQILFLMPHKATEKISGSHIEIPRTDNESFLISIKERGSDTDLIFFHGRGIANRVHNKITDGFNKYNTISFMWPGYLKKEMLINGKKFYKDLTLLADFLQERKSKTNNKIFIFGQSFGCHPALFLSSILHRPVILENPFLSLRSVLQYKLLYFLSWLQACDYDNSKYFNSDINIKTNKKDILILLSGKEGLYPSSEVNKIKNTIEQNLIPAHTISNATHYDMAKHQEFFSKIDEFIANSGQ